MSVSFDPTGDLNFCDGLETVTLQSDSGALSTAVAGALRRHDQVGEAEPSDGLHTAQHVQWHLPADQLSTPPPVGAVIIDGAGLRYVILGIELATLTSRFSCRCRRLAIASGLDQQVILQRATWTKSQSGVQVADWQDVRINLPARIQPQMAEISIEYDRRLTRVTHKIFLADEVVVDHTYRIVAGSQTYRVLGYERPERIDALFVILAAQTSAAPA